MPTISVNNATIAYTDTGVPAEVPDASTIVFGHGLLFGGWVFREQIEALRHRLRCVTIDWRGQGDTPPTPDGYDMDTLAADAVALIRELGLPPVHWVGLSMGGFIGQRIAARHGELLRSLTLLDTSAGAEEPDKVGEYQLLARLLLLVGFRPLVRTVRSLLFGPTFLADPANRLLLAEWATRIRHGNRAAIRRAVLGVAGRASVEPEISGIGVPTLVVVGADDRATPPARAEHLAALIPDARLQVVAHSGHTSPLEQPSVVTGLLATFLDTVDGS
ncbi:MAG TPA: alpha/beta fold hydrolase [Pseudonocardiaceae bacterium]|nr:alpha/beta fold hydrolase [Pseudonocardiaceae bacterium]